ncbi:VOC family protein [Halogeometricum luteum]|uniref:VOC family protein n=1 Tax=Halogeometricum luteum TaxID=2950537 RepID=A0ABU2G3P3_9EURY|nr:VOC family protein [Halogeometricum sp. S3BR5-2]MDS0294913.1 VOC family protein [Halogeometricum sp. S3BR5-2]
MDIAQLFLMTRDLERARAFYEALGFTVADEGSRSVEFDTGATLLKLQADFDSETLSQFGLSPPGDARGEGVVVVVEVPDVDAVAERVRAATDGHGGRLLAGPRDVDWGRRLVLVTDPDGYTLELSEPL